MKLIPKVNGSVEEWEGSCRIGENLVMDKDFPEGVARVFGQRMKNRGVDVTKGENPDVKFRICTDLSQEAYRLEITEDGILVEASDRRGAGYGLVTMYHLLEGREFPCCKVEDCPRYGYRGFMLDVCRHFFSKEEVLKIVEQCSLLKLNKFHFHLSDDQGFRMESRKYPLLNQTGSFRKEGNEIYGGYYTWEEMREIVLFAEERGIDIIPEIEVPGHSRAMLAAYPELGCLGRRLEIQSGGGIEKNIICAGKESSYDFLFGLLDEVCELFPGSWIHLGGDEAPKDVWKICPDCRRRMAEEGLEDYEELQGLFHRRLIDYLHKKGKQVICWNEAALSNRTGQDVVLQYWNELDRRDYVYSRMQSGSRLLFSNIHKCYANYGYGMSPLKSTYDFEPSILQHMDLPNEQVLGLECPVWTETVAGEDFLEYLIFPRFCAIAEAAWCRQRDFGAFCERLEEYLKQLRSDGVRTATVSEAVPRGKAAIRQVLTDAVRMGNLERGSGQDKLSGWIHHLTGDYYSQEMKEEILQAAAVYRESGRMP